MTRQRILICAGLTALFGCSSESTARALEDDIRQNLASRGYEVVAVHMATADGGSSFTGNATVRDPRTNEQATTQCTGQAQGGLEGRVTYNCAAPSFHPVLPPVR